MLNIASVTPFDHVDFTLPPASKQGIENKVTIAQAVEIIRAMTPQKQPPFLPKRLELKPVLSPDELGHHIGTSLDDLETPTHLKMGEEHAQFAPQAKTLFKVAQNWVVDCVLRTGTSGMQASLPFLLQYLFEMDIQAEVEMSTEWIHFNASLLDTVSGATILFFKNHFLHAAQEKVEELKKQPSLLQPDQVARLRQLEGVIHHEQQVLSSQLTEQGFRVVKSGLSITTFILTKLSSLKFFTPLEHLLKGLAGFVSVGLLGFLFHRSSQEMNAHTEWAQDFQTWQKNHAVHSPEPLTNKQGVAFTTEQIQELEETQQQLIAKRRQRQEECSTHVESLKTRIQYDATLLATIKERVKSFERASLQEFLNHVKWSEISLLTLKDQLEAKLKMTLKEEQIIRLYQAYTDLKEVEQLVAPLSQKEQQAVIDAKTRIVSVLDECLHPWIESQPQETLLKRYVDHHAMLNPVLKESLAQMVQKKQEIEGSLLKFKFLQHGIQFSATTIIAGVTLILALIGLAANPVGAAGLILLGLSIASCVLTSVLVSASFYYAYRKKPRISAANMKGAYAVLAYYQLRGKLAELREKIANFMRSIWHNRRDQTAQVINRQSVLNPQHMTPTTTPDGYSIPSIQQDFQKNVSRAKQWEDKAHALQKALEEAKWADFAEKAELIHVPDEEHHPNFLEKGPLDTLETLNELLRECDLNLLSADVQELIEKQLGIPLAVLQTEREQHPFGVKKLLQNFFNLDDSAFVNLIGRQRYLEKEYGSSPTPTG